MFQKVNKKRLAIFDFCDTIFDGQSISYFIDFLESKLPIYKKIYSKIRKKFNQIPSSESKLYKEYLLKIFSGISYPELDNISKEFYDLVIKTKLNKVVIQKLIEHKNDGYIIVIASGGFESYLKYFSNEYKIDYLFCTKLEFINNKFTGKIAGKECLGKEKVEQLKKIDLTKYDLVNSFVYSDHKSDIPLFNLVGNKVIVKRNQDISWSNENYKILNVVEND